MTYDEIKIIQFIDDEFEDLELWYPVYRMREFGAIVHLVGEKSNHLYHGKHGVPATSDFSYSDVNPALYDALLVPGGWAPDKIRRIETALNIVKQLDASKKPIGSICHGAWVLVSAGILKGRRLTSVPGIKDDLINAGAEWMNEQHFREGNLISAQRPPDIPAYMKLFVEAVQEVKDKKLTEQPST